MWIYIYICAKLLRKTVTNHFYFHCVSATAVAVAETVAIAIVALILNVPPHNKAFDGKTTFRWPIPRISSRRESDQNTHTIIAASFSTNRRIKTQKYSPTRTP